MDETCISQSAQLAETFSSMMENKENFRSKKINIFEGIFYFLKNIFPFPLNYKIHLFICFRIRFLYFPIIWIFYSFSKLNIKTSQSFKNLFSHTRIKNRFKYPPAPEFTQRLKTFLEIETGKSATFVGYFRATPPPTVMWVREDQELNNTDKHIIVTDQTTGCSVLTITHVNRKDEGPYKCKLENQEGVASSTGYLSIIGFYIFVNILIERNYFLRII